MNRCDPDTRHGRPLVPSSNANAQLAASLSDGGLNLAMHNAVNPSPWLTALRREQQRREAQLLPPANHQN